MKCLICSREHDVSTRVTGDVIWCPCGNLLRVDHRAGAVITLRPLDLLQREYDELYDEIRELEERREEAQGDPGMWSDYSWMLDGKRARLDNLAYEISQMVSAQRRGQS